MRIETIIMGIFVYGYFLLIAFWLIGQVDRKPPKKKTLWNLIKTYWSDWFLIICMLVGAQFFIWGVSV